MNHYPDYEIYAIKYAHHMRQSPDNFLGGRITLDKDASVRAVQGEGWVVGTVEVDATVGAALVAGGACGSI